MKKLLVPTDFSEQAENALKVAAQLAKKNNSELYVLHTLELPLHLANSSDSNSLPEPIYFIKLAEKNFKELLAKPFMEGIEVQEAYGHNEIYDDIREAVDSNDIDLVVMGSHGVSGFKEMFIGSNTEKVVRTSEIPVVVIKSKFKDFVFKNIIFACDFEKESSNAYEKAMKLFQELNANVHLLHVNLPNEKFRNTAQIEEKVKLFLKMVDPADVSAFDKVTFVNDYSVEDGVFSFSEKIDADAISIATHGRRGLAHFFFGSVGEDLANHSDIPVFTFRR